MLAALVLAVQAASTAPRAAAPPPFALRASKALVARLSGEQVVDDARLIVRDGRIAALGPAATTPLPEGMRELDVRPAWVMPGMIDLHTHVAGNGGDINDMVLQVNSGLRVTPTVRPRNLELKRALAAGITTMLYIPGSGTNLSGSGVLLKTDADSYEAMVVRDPGSLKIAQGDNPTRWGYGMGRGLMNWHIRGELARGLAHARAREKGAAERDIRFDIYGELLAKRTQVSTHTQIYALVMYTLEIVRREAGLDVYIDHGEWKGYLATEQARELGVSAICGPREIDAPGGRSMDYDGRIVGIAGEYQARGMELVGFNTDAPVVPAEELWLQATMGVRYGFDTRDMQGVRGLTIVPAKVSGIDARVGSLEVDKDADLVVLDGDPLDPRTSVLRVFVEGRSAWERDADGASSDAARSLGSR